MLAIAGGKGGCGKTTTALGIARCLGRRGVRPLVVDTDCDMPDIHTVTGIARNHGVDAVAEGRPLAEAVQSWPGDSDVSLLTAGTPDQTGRALRRAEQWPGPVVLDTPAGIGPDATCPLRHAGATLVVTTDAPACLEDAGRTITVADELDAPPVGALLRTARPKTASVPARVGEVPVLDDVPTVDTPLESPALARRWNRLADAIWEWPEPSPRGASDSERATLG